MQVQFINWNGEVSIGEGMLEFSTFLNVDAKFRWKIYHAVLLYF